MKRKISVISFLLLFIGSQCTAQTLRAGLLNFPPFATQDQKAPGIVYGIFVDKLMRTFDHAGLKADVRIYPPKRLFEMFERHEIDFILSAANQVERFKDVAIFCEEPILSITLAAYVFDRNIPLPQKKEDLNGLRVAAIRGYAYAGYLDYIDNPVNKIQKNIVNSHRAGFLMLMAGRADILLDYVAPAESTINALREFEFRHSKLFEMDTHFALSNTYPNPNATMDKIEKSYRELYP